jgi:hypothetical protein
MTKFKAIWSEIQFFEFKGLIYRAVGGIFETDDIEIINFLKENSGFELIEETTKKK